MEKKVFLLVLLILSSYYAKVLAQTGSAVEPVRYIGGEVADPST